MASRYPTTKVDNYCFNPRHVIDNDKDIIVPCGKCDGCLLHKSNEWSMRITNEVESNLYTIFFTLTYNNDFLPKMIQVGHSHLGFSWKSDNCFNVRFDGTRVVPRLDHISIDHPFDSVPIQNFQFDNLLPYASKRDIQLFLKLIRKDIDINLSSIYKNENLRFRYLVVSEYGPTTFRPHYHGLIFCNSCVLAEYLCDVSLYKNWQMCDKDLFQQYTKFANPSVAGYLSNYVTSRAVLPRVYQCSDIKPFRLASKNPAIGFLSFDNYEVSQKVSSGNIEYIKEVAAIDSKFIFRYPKAYMRSVFPKCFQYRKLIYRRLYEIYSACYLDAQRRRTGEGTISSFNRLRAFMHPMNFNASLKCYKFCVQYGCNPHYYLYCLDMYYYKADMYALSQFYQSMEHKDVMDIARSYDNFGYLVQNRHHLRRSLQLAIELFLVSLNIQYNDWDSVDLLNTLGFRVPNVDYENEVKDILDNSVKVPKFNEKYGFAPHIV